MSLPRVSVLMVCMGNICRSPTAEGLLRHKLREAGLDHQVSVDSAGTAGYHIGAPPDGRAQRHALQHGIDISGLRARQVRLRDFERFDLLLAMDEDNMATLMRLCPPGYESRVRLMMSFARRQDPPRADVPDPYYGGPEGFDNVLDLLDDACDGLVAHLRPHLGGTS